MSWIVEAQYPNLLHELSRPLGFFSPTVDRAHSRSGAGCEPPKPLIYMRTPS